MKKLTLFFFVFLISFSSQAKTDNQDGVWFGTFAKRKLTNDISYWLETQLRYNATFGEMAQILYRTGALQKINDKHGLGYLYGYIQGGNNKEHRLTLQHTQNYTYYQNFKLSHRIRVEGRFFEDNPNDAVRFRYLVRGDQVDFSKWGVVVWNEIFTNLTDETATEDQFLERNRLFIGFKKFLLENSRIEFGYLNQFVPRDAEDISEHLLTLYLFF